jgi:hypothetical protein
VAASWRSIANSQWRGRPEDRTGHALVSAIRLNPAYGMETIFLIEIAWLIGPIGDARDQPRSVVASGRSICETTPRGMTRDSVASWLIQVVQRHLVGLDLVRSKAAQARLPRSKRPGLPPTARFARGVPRGRGVVTSHHGCQRKGDKPAITAVVCGRFWVGMKPVAPSGSTGCGPLTGPPGGATGTRRDHSLGRAGRRGWNRLPAIR